MNYYSLTGLKDPRVEKLPYSIRVLLESALRNYDDFEIKKQDIENILDWEKTSQNATEIPFKPARVIMQDFTGVPAVVDLTAMRDAMHRLGGDPDKINPLVPSDLVIDHSVQVDFARSPDAAAKNQALEFERNKERFAFLKWGASAYKNMLIVPPGSGIVHQVNLEYLARVVFDDSDTLYPDSVVGTDSHTTMIDGLGVVGWGVGGIEAEAVMLGQPISMVLPEVVGFKLTGKLHPLATATDVVLTVTQMLRKHGVVGKFVEFFGEGCKSLKLADRATIANMSPEYGATMGFFPVDAETLAYLRTTGRSEEKIARVEKYLKANGLFRTWDKSETDPVFSSLLELDLNDVVPCVSGPKRPHDRVKVSDLKADFHACMPAPNGFKGFGVKPEDLTKTAKFTFGGKEYDMKHGQVVIAAITSCTNTSNPSVMLGAGLLAKNAVARGLSVAPFIKTSLSPGSGVADCYLKESGLIADLEKLGFYVAGFGCMTCIGNSGDLDEAIANCITQNDMVASAVLSGNRNFEARVHPLTKANYLASPPLVVAYALAGTVDIDFEKQPIGKDSEGKDVFLSEIWPSAETVAEIEKKVVRPEVFKDVYGKVASGENNPQWKTLAIPEGKLYKWDEKSTYIHNPPFFQTMGIEPEPVKDIKEAYCLLNLGDSITTDHISPASRIAKGSPAAVYLTERGVEQKDFNSYGSRRGNDEIMARGTFANVRLINKLASETGPLTVYLPSGEQMAVYDAASKYMAAGLDLVILAGKEYGSGSSRDWAAKGPKLQGVKAVIAESYERIHRSNLVGMGILPLQFLDGQSAETLGLTGKERFTIKLSSQPLVVGMDVEVDAGGKKLMTKCRLDTDVEVAYFQHGGILQYVLRRLLKG
eukprot:Cvel_2356.t1-p1 / transcript=Cvel_2356.t1 / gene=Cvel_2356 / organism=Chromera_velia_CCMP2878 / gene_product=Aconitate hydratase, cytoplasmic, putative / transcript_product=Aconitate hydratase, cytoplasmic, putative / location=Cvel_scaffold91:66300-71710(+) / protein_length=874 / sequence_SO=supercontig / SO=protein_coding / is_pseudo=false